MLARLRATDDNARWLLAGAVLVGLLVAVPLVVSGPGNDLDVANVFRSGRAIALHGRYVPSRAPGAPVHEALVGVLDQIGGPLLTNLASLVAAAAALVGLDRLLAREGVGHGRWAVAFVAVNPWFVIAATSTADYVFALAFLVWGALALRTQHPVWAGAAFALAMGCRVGSATLIVAALLAELTQPAGIVEATSTIAARRRAIAVAAGVGALGTALLFVPSYLAAGGLSFAQNDFSPVGPLNALGRAAVKDVTLFGTATVLLLLVTVPALWAAIKRWRVSWPVRFALVGLVLSQVLFVRFPWKVPHLLPTLLCAAVLLAVALDSKPRVLMLLVAVQLVSCLVRVDLISPNDPNAATSGKAGLVVGAGPVVQDWRCRREHPDAYRGRQKVEVEAAWDCAKPFGG